MATETPKSRLDGFEAMVEQHEFGHEHRIISLEAVQSIDYLNEVTKLRPTFNKQEVLRFKQLKKRFGAVYFSRPENRQFKRYAGFYFPGLYCKLGAMFNKVVKKPERL